VAEAKVEYDWSDVTGHAVERLRKPKITPVPDKVRELAQASWDGVAAKGKDGSPKLDGEGNPVLLHNLRHRFGSDAEAAAFAKLVKKAGPHTTPRTSVSAVIDPDDTKDLRTVAWRAGQPRGRQAATT
jgi:hypothetical protein